ncbi:hypothetical protein [Nocardia sp. CA-290969]|uniref:hypothetical protein n=1 Tax=Nocardia sp. CA-290969 TaxID=3239986 RepID=UPI003D8EE064
MTDVTVDLASLAGFELDLRDMGASFVSNASRYLPLIALPAGTSGLMGTLATPLETFRSTVSTAVQAERTAIDTFGTNLATAATGYRSTDDTTSNAVSAATAPLGASGAPAPSGEQGVNRFGGLQLPSLPDVPETETAIRQTVSSAIAQIQVYDDAFAAVIGKRPAADYLTPLVADWEALQTIGQRISWIGINDYVTSENLVNGTRWLQSSWTGEASQAFGNSTGGLAQAIGSRSADLDAVSKIVENGGIVLERLAYNQAAGLSAMILRTITHKQASFPLGVWASLIGNPMPESLRSEITSALDELRNTAESRHTAITAMAGTLSGAVEYSPGRSAPVYNPSAFEVPEKVVADPGVAKYGFGDNVWWQESNASAG